jgi:hypothetical protein
VGQTNLITISSPFNNNASPSAAWAFAPASSSQQTISVTFNGATNPTSCTDAGKWQVQTFNLIGGQPYLVDSGTSLTSFTPTFGQMTQSASISVVPATTSSTNSVYTFSIQPEHSIPVYGSLQFELPTDLSIASSAMVQSSCIYILPVTGSSLSQFCNVSTSSGVTTVTMTLSVAHSSGYVLKVSMQGFKNPRTLSPTQSFTITSTAKDGSKIDVSSGSGFTVQMFTL